MKNLLKADFYRLLKDKGIKWAFIITAILALIQIGSLYILSDFQESLDEALGSAITMGYDTKYAFAYIFSIADNFGLLVPIFICLFIGKDFTYGTIRNKIAAGHSKTKIYLSSLITASVIGISLILFNCIVTLLFGSLIVGWENEFDFLWVLKTIGLGTLLYLVSISITLLLQMVTQSSTSAIVFSLLILFIGFIASFTLKMVDGLETLMSFTVFQQSSLITQEVTSSTSLIGLSESLKIIGSSVVSIGIINTVGIAVFKDKDLK